MRNVGRSMVVVGGVAALSLAIQLLVAARPDWSGDVVSYRLWTRALVEHGVEAYWSAPELMKGYTPIDYPPVYPYMLWAIGQVVSALAPGAFANNDSLIDWCVKLPGIAANLLMAWLVLLELRRNGKPGVAIWGFAAVALNPALLFNTAYWGQSDSICALGILGAFAAGFRGRPGTAWALLTLASFAKPFAYTYAPLLGLVTLDRSGWRGIGRGAVGGVATTILVLLPFVTIGRLPDLIERLFSQMVWLPYVSLNAHNLWWILCGGLPWVRVDGSLLDLVSYKTIGLSIFGAFYLFLLWTWWSDPRRRCSWFYPASVAIGFFMLSTYMHENHLTYFLPLAAAFAVPRARFRWIFGGLSVAILLNMVLHDPELSAARIFTAGPVIEIGYMFGGDISVFRLILTVLNSQAHLLLFVAWMWMGLRTPDAADSAVSRRSARSIAFGVAGLVALLALTAAPFVVRQAEAKIIRPAPRHLPGEDVHFDMIARFAGASVVASENRFLMLGTFVIGSDARQVVYNYPDASFSFKLVVPERATLSFSHALAEEAWSQPQGDGVEFRIDLETESSTVNLYAMHLDPAHVAEHRRWVDASVDLGEYAGRRVTFVFYTGAGPQRNYLYDWPGWSNPRIVVEDGSW